MYAQAASAVCFRSLAVFGGKGVEYMRGDINKKLEEVLAGTGLNKKSIEAVLSGAEGKQLADSLGRIDKEKLADAFMRLDTEALKKRLQNTDFSKIRKEDITSML